MPFFGDGLAGLLGRWAGYGGGSGLGPLTTPNIQVDENGQMRGGMVQQSPLGQAMGAAHQQGPLAGIADLARMAILGRGGFGTAPFSAVMQGGKPQRVYHGTPIAFRDFRVTAADPEALYGPGFYFTENAKVASSYANPGGGYTTRQSVRLPDVPEFLTMNPDAVRLGGGGGWTEFLLHRRPNVRPAYLDITNPFRIDAHLSPVQFDVIAAQAKKMGGTTMTPPPEGGSMLGHAIYNDLVDAMHGAKETAQRVLQAVGYDGITHIGGQQSGGAPHRVWIAFHPKQIIPAFTPTAELP